MYRNSGAGKEPVAPALMAMAALLQGYSGSSDAETVELTVVDLRWQMVLDILGAEEPAFSQGAFQEFRQRLIRSDMDRRLLERTVEVARKTMSYNHRKPQEPAGGNEFEPNRGSGSGRGHSQPARPHGAQGDRLRSGVTALERVQGVRRGRGPCARRTEREARA
jgi:hypothetical protein